MGTLVTVKERIYKLEGSSEEFTQNKAWKEKEINCERAGRDKEVDWLSSNIVSIISVKEKEWLGEKKYLK